MQEKELVLRMICNSIAYYPNLAKALGSVEAGVLLSYLLSKTAISEGNWRAFTEEGLFEDTGLNKEELGKARATLKAVGVLEDEEDSAEGPSILMPGAIYFRLHIDRLLEVLSKYEEVQT